MHVYRELPAEYTAGAAFCGVRDMSDIVHKFFLIMYANILMSSLIKPTINMEKYCFTHLYII